MSLRHRRAHFGSADLWRALRYNCSGNVAMTFALSLLPANLLVGIALEFSSD
jgi:Flp pilus assembly protein TadG